MAEQAQRRGGGGGSGRAHLGQGDARNFGGNAPPTHRADSVNPSEFRRLQQSKTQTRTTGASQPLFRPPSMFANGRGSNSRRPGLLNLTGAEGDSSASSRTGTPPVSILAQKDKKEKEEKEATTKNAFR